MADLTAPQRQSLEQLLAVTNGTDEQVAAGVLESVNWDVEVRRQPGSPTEPSHINVTTLAESSEYDIR